jgi:hypothetical protein
MPNRPTEAPPLPAVAFVYQGVRVSIDENRLINLTEMWEAAGRRPNRDPRQWRRKEGVEFVRDLASSLNVPMGHIFSTRRGRGGATWGHWQVSLAYAAYLSPAFHRFVNEAFREWAEEVSDPGLKVARAIEAYRRRGRDNGWIADRIEGIGQRKALVAAMADHICRKVGAENPFAEATRAISLLVLGATPSELKESRGLPRSARTRDHLDRHELARLRFAESEAERLIKLTRAIGNDECVACCRRAGAAVRQAIDSLAP